MTSARPVREEFLEPVRRVLRWLASLRDSEGRIVCPDHQVEHTGKNVGAAVIACELLARDPTADAAWLVDLAVGQARRACLNLQREGTSPCFTFRPGRHDPFNCSNAVIDGGAASDALAHVVQSLGPRLTAADRERFVEASRLHARTYLRYAVLDKGIPAQRAWGLTGLAAAAGLQHDPELEKAAVEAIGVLEGIQHPDGSYPYHPLEWGAEHPGSADVSSFYQSRIPAFLMHALERMGRDPRDELFATPIRRGLDFARALQGPDGIKCGLVEAKPWYWGAEYEVASNPFDVQAFASGWRLFRNPADGLAALRAFRAFAAHLEPDGRPRSHLPGHGRAPSYQCPVFWAGHCLWIARALDDLEAIASAPAPYEPGPGTIDVSLRWFPNAQLGRLEDGQVVAWVRGARPAVNVHHGSPHGAGLVRVYGKAQGRDLLTRCRLGGANEGEWSGTAGWPSPARGWRGGGSELRFSLWLARVAARRGRLVEALLTPPRVARRGVLAFGHPRVSSAFDLAPDVRLDGTTIVIESRLAHRDGSRVGASRLTRSYEVDGSGLVVVEDLSADGGARRLGYRVPREASDVRDEGRRISWRLG
ncbi:MAG: hypothetical protein NTY35_00445 [Planctomycetota bacterium]|nr:hypothetical protein [Planctomycetota bacterium]